MIEFITLLSMIFCSMVGDFCFPKIKTSCFEKWDDKIVAGLHAFWWMFIMHLPMFILIFFGIAEVKYWLLIVTVLAGINIHAFTGYMRERPFGMTLAESQLIHLGLTLATNVLLILL